MNSMYWSCFVLINFRFWLSIDHECQASWILPCQKLYGRYIFKYIEMKCWSRNCFISFQNKYYTNSMMKIVKVPFIVRRAWFSFVFLRTCDQLSTYSGSCHIMFGISTSSNPEKWRLRWRNYQALQLHIYISSSKNGTWVYFLSTMKAQNIVSTQGAH